MYPALHAQSELVEDPGCGVLAKGKPGQLVHAAFPTEDLNCVTAHATHDPDDDEEGDDRVVYPALHTHDDTDVLPVDGVVVKEGHAEHDASLDMMNL